MSKSYSTYLLSSKFLFFLITIVTLLSMLNLSGDFGLTEDSLFHQKHGERILSYFKGENDLASLSPLDAAGNFVDVNQGQDLEIKGMNSFGGFFDLIASFLYQYFPNQDLFVFRNKINAIFGWLLFLFSGLIAKELFNWRASIVTFLFFLTVPVILGHSFNNPKDIPFSTFYVICLFHLIKLLKELPVFKVKRMLFLAFNISLLVNIRLTGLFIFPFCVLSLSIWMISFYRQKNLLKESRSELLGIFIKFGISLLLGYLLVPLFWPYLYTKPFTGVVELFFKLKAFEGFQAIQLFEGEFRNSFQMPWYYLFYHLILISLPIHILIGFLLSFIPLFKFKSTKKLILFVLLLACVIPLLLAITGGVNSYDHGRQFLFVTPPLVILSSIGVYYTIRLLPKIIYKSVFITVLTLTMIEPIAFIIENHPLQVMYFNPLVNGIEGAFGKYEIDYYGNAIKSAVGKVETYVEKQNLNTPKNVRLFYGGQHKLKYYADKSIYIDHVVAAESSDAWDYSIVTLSEAKYNTSLFENWPPKNTVDEVKVNNTVVVAIVENPLNKGISAQSYENNIQKSLNFYQRGDYLNSIRAAKKAIKQDTLSYVAYNNMCASYNQLKMYEKAEKACQKSLEIAKDFQLAFNNLQRAIDGRKNFSLNNLSSNELLNLGLNYYSLQDYESSIVINKFLIENFPNNYIAYNNLCSSYNALGKWNLAIESCSKALELNPDFELAKNNLNWSKLKIKENK